jgi:MFS family permease
LLSLITNYLLLNTGDHNWRWKLFSGAIPAVAFFLMLLVIRKSPRWLVAFLVLYIAFFASSQGVVIWVLLSEMFPNIIRARGASLGSFANWCISAALNFSFPVLIGFFGTTQAARQQGMSYAFIFFAALTFIGFLYIKKYIIETKGKTLEQIEKEVLWFGK